jgi:uncharacterized protein DUF4189
MKRLGSMCAVVMTAALAASSPAGADGAIAVGSTANVVKDGIAVGTSSNYESASAALEAALKRCRSFKPAPKAATQCRSVGTFKNECYAISFDPKEGTPGAGWAIAPTKELAEERALGFCQVTAGEDRRDFCKIEESKCDGN